MTRQKTRCFGIKPKNYEQQIAISALLDPSIDLVILEGIAGSGKTMLALAAGLEQVIEQKMYNEIIFTRAPVSVGDSDMGFLPGTEQDKLLPWCGAVMDNLEQLVGTNRITTELVETKIKFKALQFMRGRSFVDRYLIIDEAQNITVQQMKVLLTRAGENTKIVILGDIHQIDNRKLTLENNALALLWDSAHDNSNEFIKAISLPSGVRSRICTWAAGNL
jgi:PhoH-like ATPase